MRFMPLFHDLSSGTVALIGTGAAARTKLSLLRSAGAKVRWYVDSADIAEELLSVGAPCGRVEVDCSDPLTADFSQFIAVIAATGTVLDEAIARRAHAANALINVVDRAELSNVIVPALVDRGDVVVAIGTGGASPALARRIRERIEALLPARIGDLAALMGRYRAAFHQARHASVSLRRFWERIIDGPIGTMALSGRWRDAERGLVQSIEASRQPRVETGVVSLVGAGPGDPDLLTLRAHNALQNADVVFYDELIGREILERARRDAELIFVGKRRGEPGLGQAEINRRLAEAARAGKNVVRLKGGDPFIFGRGGEELEYLRKAGIATMVVPGITAALGCAAEIGLPLTFRNEATRLTFVTAHLANGAEATDWFGLADPHTTLVVYMGLSNAASVRDRLIAAGRDPLTPIAVLARGTRRDTQSAVGRLSELAALATRVGEGPALLVIGDVVARSDIWLAAADPATVEIAA